LVAPPQARAADDEDAAESQPDDLTTGEAINVIAPPPAPMPRTNAAIASNAPPQQPRVAAMQPLPQTAAVAFKPAASNVPVPSTISSRPAAKPTGAAVAAAAATRPLEVASVTPSVKPKAKSDNGEGDIGDSGVPTALKGTWTIQIGAFADMTQARGQLALYAEKSMDVLGQAARIIVPFTAVGGHTLYRARFGPFVEREAREVCARLSQRGQTCFAAIASTH
jgi:D-alanyl-D-alanine carboxypeptidase